MSEVRRTMIHEGIIHYASPMALVEFPKEVTDMMPIPAFNFTLCMEWSSSWQAILPETDTRIVNCETCKYMTRVEDVFNQKYPDHTELEHFACIGGIWHKVYAHEKKLHSVCGYHPEPYRFHLMMRFRDRGRLVHTDCFVNEVPEPEICEGCLETKD